MDQEQLERIIVDLLHDRTTVQMLQEKVMMIKQGRNAVDIHSLAESIRQTSRRAYGDLTDNMLSQVVDEIREQYRDVADITLDDWADEEVLKHLVDMHNYVRNRLAELLHKEGHQIGWGIVGKIINAVFGNVPVITKSVRESLHQLGFLRCPYTQCIQTLLKAVCGFWNRNRDIIINGTAEVIIHGIIGLGQPPQMAATILVPIILTKIFNVVYKEIIYHRNINARRRN